VVLVELGLVEQRYRAVCEVLDGASVTDVARRNGVARVGGSQLQAGELSASDAAGC
jgi:transposase-like protein